MRILLLTLCIGVAALVQAQDLPADEDQLLDLHRQLLQAHLNGDVDAWMALEADTVVSANRGTVSFSAAAERRVRRARYLDNAEFSIYRDLRAPVVHVSDDGTLGWLIAEVEVKGTLPNEEGVREAFHDFWAWIELYEKTDMGWRLIGNVSNLKPTADLSVLHGRWEMHKVYQDGQDVTAQHNPSGNRWIELAADGRFVSDGDPYGRNTGRWTYTPATQELFLDSNAGEGDDSYWIIRLEDGHLVWQGTRSDFTSRFQIIHRRPDSAP